MRSVVLAAGRVSVQARPPRELVADEARIRVRLAGICSTDLQILSGYMGGSSGFSGVPGHEFVGDVFEGPGEWLGARVVGEINAACASCPTCRDGRPRHCPRRSVLGILGRDGAHAEELRLPAANLHRVPDSVSDEAAVFVEPLAAAWHVVEQVSVSGRRLAVLGAGKLGHLVALSAALAGAEVVAIGRSPRKLERLRQAGVATLAAPAGAESLAARGFDVVVDATGSPEGLALALRLVRPCGTIVAKTTIHASTAFPLAPLVVDEVTVIGSRCGRFEPAIRLLAEGRIDPRRLIDARLPLERAAEAYGLAARGDLLKVLLEPLA